MDDIGLEPKNISTLHDNNLQKIDIPRAAKSGASQINIAEIPDDLQQLVEAWSVIPGNIKQAVQLLAQPFLFQKRSS